MANDKNLKGVYETLKREGYTPPAFDEFVKDMQDEENLRGVHATLTKSGYTPPEYGQFRIDMLGNAAVSQPQQEKSQATATETATPQQTAEQPVSTPAPAPQPTWQPTEQEKIQMSYRLNSMMSDFNKRSRARVEQARRVAERNTPEGRRKLKAAKFQAQLAGTPTQVMGLTPDVSASPSCDGQGATGEQAKPLLSGQGPVPYGVVEVDGKRKTQWLLPDGSLTTDFMEADKAEYSARTARLRHQFENRMKENGFDPSKQEDVTRQSIIDRIADNRRRQYAKDAEVAEAASSDMEWHDDEGFFDNLGRLARNSIMRSENVQFGSAVSEEADADLHNLKAENYVLSKALTRLDANRLKKSEGVLGGLLDVGNNLTNLGAGFADAAHDENLYLGGMVELNMARQLMAIDRKVQNGIALSDTDKNLVYAALLNIDAELSGNLPHMCTAATITAEMAPFMIEMIANPASGLSQSMVRQFGRSAIARFGKNAIRKNAKKYALGKVTATLTGDVAQSAVLANTLQAPKTVADAMQRFVGNPIVDGNGRVIGFDGDHDAIEAFAKAEGTAVIENYTEMLGNHFGIISKYLGKGASAVANKIGLGGVVENTSELIGRIKGSDWGKAISEMEKRAQWNGTLGEIAEEEAGIVLNSMFVGDNSISDLVDADQQIDIVLGVGLFGGFVSGIKAAGYVVGRRKANMQLRSYERIGQIRYGEEWGGIQSAIDNAEDSDVAHVVRTLAGNAQSHELAQTVVNYAHALMKARGYNLAHAKKNAELSEQTEATPEQATVIEAENQSEAAYDSAQELYGRFEQGDPEAQAEIDAISLRMTEAHQLCEDAFGDEAEVYMAEIKENPWGILNDPELTPDQKDAVLYYINANAALDGILDASNEAASDKRQRVQGEVARRTHKERGVIIPATMKMDDKPVYIINGEVAMFPDGSGVDVRNSSEAVIILDESGEYKFTSPNQIMSVGETIDPQIELQTAYDAIDREQEAIISAATDGVPESPEIVLNSGENEEITAETSEETPQSVPNVEEYDRGYDEGTRIATTLDDNILNTAIDDLRGRDFLTDEWRGRLEAYEYEQQRRAMEDSQAAAENIPQDGNNAGQNIPGNTQEGETAPSALEKIPVDEQTGDPILTHESVDADTAWDAAIEFFGTPEDALSYVQAEVSNAKSAITTAEKAVSKVKPTGGMIKYRDELKAARDKVEVAKGTLAKWQAIEEVQKRRKADEAARKAAEIAAKNAQLHDEAVARFEEEQRIKAEKQAEQERIGTHAVNPKIKEKWKTATKVDGHPDIITLPDGSALSGHYVMTEAGAASASHDVNNAFEPTEGFPIDKNGQSVNDRDYKRDRDAQQIVQNMADAYDSRAMQTPVFVSKDGVVLSGNNRTMSGDIAAAQGTDGAYLEYLNKFGRKFGFTPEQMEGMKHPRVVFVPDDDLPYDATTFSRFNAPEMKSQSKPEAAIKLGKIVDDAVFNRIVADLNRYDRLSDFYADQEAAYIDKQPASEDKPQPDKATEEKPISGLEGYTRQEIKDIVSREVEQIFSDADIDAEIVGMEIHGSRNRGDARPDSDLDIVLEYKGDMKEYAMFNAINETPIEIEGIQVDVNPIRAEETGTLSDYMKKSRSYDEEKLREAEASAPSLGDRIAEAEATVNTEPTEAQKEAGNYRKGHVNVEGFDVTIEQPKGSVRRGKDANGNPWESKMNNTYGYIRGTEGVDGDHIDVFLSDTPEEGNVYVVDQYEPDGTFDEHKVMYGFPDAEAARSAYLSNYEKGWDKTRRIDVTGVTKEDFKKWIQSSRRKTKPFADYKSVDTINYDNQGNPIDNTNRLIVEDVDSINEITDKDFITPTRTIGLPQLPDNVSEAIGAEGRQPIIKRNIFKKNRDSHKDLSPGDSRKILNGVLYNPNLFGQNQKETRPYNWILVHLADKNSSVILEVNPTKEHLEIVNWHYLNGRQLEQKKRQAEREGGRILTLHESNAAGDTSQGLSSDGKDNTLLSEEQGNRTESSKGYTITPTTYTRKKGKGGETPVWVVKFDRDLSYEEKKALVAYMKEPLEEGRKVSRGWIDKESGDFFMRSEEAAKGLAAMIGNDEVVADAQPLSAEDYKSPLSKPEASPETPQKPVPMNRVDVEGLFNDLNTKGETRLSDHAEPAASERPLLTDDEIVERLTTHPMFQNLVDNNPDTDAAHDMMDKIMNNVRVALRKSGNTEDYRRLTQDRELQKRLQELAFAKRSIQTPAPEPKRMVVDDEMRDMEDELRSLLGIDDSEGDRSDLFRNPEDFTNKERMQITSLGITYALKYFDQGIVSFPDFADKMVRRMGEKIRP